MSKATRKAMVAMMVGVSTVGTTTRADARVETTTTARRDAGAVK